MMNLKMITLFLLLIALLSSCGEEVLTKSTITTSTTGSEVDRFEIKECASHHFEKPPVDILFVVDNSGSTLLPSFQAIKSQIANTVSMISGEFDYHVYIAPLLSNGESINSYPLLLNVPDSIPNLTNVNVIQPNNLDFFSGVTGNNAEHGFSRAFNIINANRTNGIFRNNANTIIVMISNGDDTESMDSILGNQLFNQSKFDVLKNKLLSLTKKYVTNTTQNPMNATSFRFLSLVSHSNCNGFKFAANYKKMSSTIYNAMGYSDDPKLNSYDLCSNNYSNLFSSVNNSIKEILVGHIYDHSLVTEANVESIQADDITLTKVIRNKDLKVVGHQNIPRSNTNGFTYLGYRQNINSRFFPDDGLPITGLVVRLNGNAKITYPDCIIAKTRTPTEHFGYIALSTEPDENSIKVFVRGEEVAKSTSNGWSYIGFLETKNIKVPGPTNTPIEPALNKSGYFIKLHGNAVYSNGENVEVSFKAKSIEN